VTNNTLGLRWGDIDFAEGTISVRQQVVPTKSGLVVQDLKTEYSRRKISVSQKVVKELRAHRSRQAQERLRAGASYEDRDLIFCDGMGRPLDPRRLTRHFERTLKRADLPKMTFHDLRHTFATLALEEGVPIKAVQETLGHHTAEFTMNVYSHVTERMRRIVSEKMEKILGQ